MAEKLKRETIKMEKGSRKRVRVEKTGRGSSKEDRDAADKRKKSTVN